MEQVCYLINNRFKLFKSVIIIETGWSRTVQGGTTCCCGVTIHVETGGLQQERKVTARERGRAVEWRPGSGVNAECCSEACMHVEFADSLSQPWHRWSSVTRTSVCPTPPVVLWYRVPSARKLVLTLIVWRLEIHPSLYLIASPDSLRLLKT